MSESLLSLSATGITSWMLFSLLISALVVLAALAAHDAQRAANRAVRFVWMIAILAIVGLSFAAPLRQSTSPLRTAFKVPMATQLSKVTVERVPTLMSQVDAVFGRALDVVRIPAEAALQALSESLNRLPTGIPIALLALWLLASCITIGAFAVTYIRLRRLVQQWPVQRVDNTIARIAPTSGPAVIGLAPTEIVLPSWLLERSSDEQRLVIAHEREHVMARDPWLLVAACAAVALMPWNPALWFALNRLRLAVELDCDRRVLQRGVGAGRYGALLIDLSALRPDASSLMPSLSMPAFSCNSSFLERRLLAMTSRPSKFRTSRRLAGGLLALAAVITACESKLPTSAEIEKMDVSSAQAQAKKVALVADGKTQYVVDGKAVSEELAKKIASESIATVRVRKADTGNGVNEIAITTNRAAQHVELDAAGKQAAEREARGTMLRRTRQLGADSTYKVAPDVQMTRKKFDGLLLIDDKIVDSSELDRMSPDKISTIEVLKGEAAKGFYKDPRAANGVIKVVTKR